MLNRIDELTPEQVARMPEWRDKIKVDAISGCWVWIGAINNGYGRIRLVTGKLKYAHRELYELIVGKVPEGMQLDHLCRNRCCVNPIHLEVVSPRENVQRGLRGALITQCPHGHHYTPENTLNDRGWRRCRACHSAKAAANRRAFRKAGAV